MNIDTLNDGHGVVFHKNRRLWDNWVNQLFSISLEDQKLRTASSLKTCLKRLLKVVEFPSLAASPTQHRRGTRSVPLIHSNLCRY